MCYVMHDFTVLVMQRVIMQSGAEEMLMISDLIYLKDKCKLTHHTVNNSYEPIKLNSMLKTYSYKVQKNRIIFIVIYDGTVFCLFMSIHSFDPIKMFSFINFF